MGLTTCSECGRSISNLAMECPYCGINLGAAASDVEMAIPGSPSMVIGFDLGDGESALSMCKTSDNGEPDLLTLIGNKPSFLTCLGRDASGRILIGESALENSNMNTVYLTFKKSPTNDSFGESLRAISTFFSEVMRRAAAAGCNLQDALIVLGHPSAWSRDDVEKYSATLMEETNCRVSGVSESRAAFLQLKETGKLTPDQLRDCTLIIDIGSSTTDFTLVKNLKEQPIEFGDNSLGGRLIDRGILNELVANHRDRHLVEAIFFERIDIKSVCEYLCRCGKEKFFSDEPSWRETNQVLRGGITQIDDETVFNAKIDASLIDKVLETPQAELAGKSWLDGFSSALESVRTTFGKSNEIPKTIALTGGGSRMGFTHQICRRIFPDTNIISDQMPEFCIARGLARAGRWDIRSKSFLNELKPIWVDLLKAFKQESEGFLKDVVPALTTGFLNDVLKKGLVNWRSGLVLTLADLEGHIKSLGKSWAEEPEVNSIVTSATARWTDRSMLLITPKLNDICHRFGLPASTLTFNLDGPRPTGLKIDGRIATEQTSEELSLLAGGVAGIVGIQVAMVVTPIILLVLLKMTLISAAFTGPIGWVIGGLIALSAALVGREAAEEEVKQFNIPKFARGLVVTDSKIEDICRKATSEVEQAINDELGKAIKTVLAEQAAEVVRNELERKMKDALVLIRH